MSRAMKCRPSAVYNVDGQHGSYAAYCFDTAIVAWGTAFEADVHKAVESAKTPQARQAAQGRVLRRWVDVGAAGYADPARR